MKKLLAIPIVLILLLVTALPAVAATTQDVTITATPAFVTISNAPGTWAINDVAGAGGKTILPNTTYYSNPLGDTTAPSETVLVGECRFTVDSTGSTVNIDLTVNFPNHANGDASTNSDDGTNAAGSFGAFTYWEGKTFASKVVAKAAASAIAYSGLAKDTTISWGIQYISQSGAWTSGTAMTSTVVITAAPTP